MDFFLFYLKKKTQTWYLQQSLWEDLPTSDDDANIISAKNQTAGKCLSLLLLARLHVKFTYTQHIDKERDAHVLQKLVCLLTLPLSSLILTVCQIAPGRCSAQRAHIA